MFDKSFQTLYTWETQNLQLKMDVLQCNIVQQMLFILVGSVPQTKVEQPEVEMSVHESIDGKNINTTNEPPPPPSHNTQINRKTILSHPKKQMKTSKRNR